MRRFFIILLSIIVRLAIIGQSTADCTNAIHFVDSLGKFSVNKGHGRVLEIKGHDIKNEYYFTKEHHSVWIMMTFTRPTMFAFELVPHYSQDDFDFIVFRSFGGNFCSAFDNAEIPVPLRSNLSKKRPDEGSITGLKLGYENLYAPAGDYHAFSAPIMASVEDTLYLVFDSPYGYKGGFTILNQSTYQSIEPNFTQDDYHVEDEFEFEPNPAMIVRVIDEEGETISSPFSVLKIGKKNTDKFEINNVGEFVLREEIKGKHGQFIISQKDYLQKSTPIYWGGDRDTVITIMIEKLKVGSVLQFENINFAPNSAQILPESRSELEDLKTFLINNPHISVEIGGHVNSMKKRNSYRLKKLSKKRAQVIYEFLLTNGVNSNSLKYKGYGNSRLIYKTPSNEAQNKANRRVEITVTKI
jgi:outer membrane protein OmpA-like peptidoglycan-associated protein